MRKMMVHISSTVHRHDVQRLRFDRHLSAKPVVVLLPAPRYMPAMQDDRLAATLLAGLPTTPTPTE
jgi:hypothetical protein